MLHSLLQHNSASHQKMAGAGTTRMHENILRLKFKYQVVNVSSPSAILLLAVSRTSDLPCLSGGMCLGALDNAAAAASLRSTSHNRTLRLHHGHGKQRKMFSNTDKSTGNAA